MVTISNKYSWVDVSKGFVICLMVIGHSSLPSVAARWIWSFHMPFFFIISALFTNWDKYPLKEFIRRKSKVLLLPFIVYSVINLALIPFALGVPHLEYVEEILCNGWGGIALWFVPVFFLSLVICKLVPSRYLFLAGFIFLVAGAMFSKENISFPWTLSSVPYGAALMLITRYFKDAVRQWIKMTSYTGWMTVIIAGALVSLFISHFYRLDMACNSIMPAIPILAGVAGGFIFCVGLAHMLDKTPVVGRLLRHIGHNTYEVMALSQCTIMVCNEFLPELSWAKYAVMVVILVMAVYARKIIEGKFSKVEAI